jgi:diketogulonate reductase-like aldo/keto reductase
MSLVKRFSSVCLLSLFDHLISLIMFLSWVLSATKVMPSTDGYEATAQGIDASLQKLGLGEYRYVSTLLSSQRLLTFGPYLDYVDLFLIHDPKAEPSIRLDKYRALLGAQKAGKIRTVGVSN